MLSIGLLSHYFVNIELSFQSYTMKTVGIKRARAPPPHSTYVLCYMIRIWKHCIFMKRTINTTKLLLFIRGYLQKTLSSIRAENTRLPLLCKPNTINNREANNKNVIRRAIRQENITHPHQREAKQLFSDIISDFI